MEGTTRIDDQIESAILLEARPTREDSNVEILSFYDGDGREISSQQYRQANFNINIGTIEPVDKTPVSTFILICINYRYWYYL